MKSDYTKRADDLKELLEGSAKRKTYVDERVEQLIGADIASHVLLAKEGIPEIDMEIAGIVHNLIATELSVFVELQETLAMSMAGIQAILDEQLELATKEEI